MPIKNQVVTFKMTETGLEQLDQSCRINGFRNRSEFLRHIVGSVIEHGNTQSHLIAPSLIKDFSIQLLRMNSALVRALTLLTNDHDQSVVQDLADKVQHAHTLLRKILEVVSKA